MFLGVYLLSREGKSQTGFRDKDPKERPGDSRDASMSVSNPKIKEKKRRLEELIEIIES